jgi:adenosylmethionine-8-amino-7-oxononanoate aminotransferase
MILDEIATGFGRNRRMVCPAAHAGVGADIMCIGKAITGGYLSFAATLCTDSVA